MKHQIRKHHISKLLLLAALAPLAANAGVFVEGGLHAGGDELATVSFIGGSNETIEAGGLLSGVIGAELGLSDSVDLRLGLGIKLDSVNAENGDIDFSRVTLDALAFYRASEDWHIGAGITRHSSTEFTGSGFASGLDVDFDDAIGLLLAIEYQLGVRGYLGLRLTSIDYTASASNVDVDGNSIGVVIGYRFGK